MIIKVKKIKTNTSLKLNGVFIFYLILKFIIIYENKLIVSKKIINIDINY